MDEKEFLKQLKAVFYQLFNRKLPFVMFDKTEANPDGHYLPNWLFTNVDYETMLTYDAKPDYFYNQVTIFNTEFTAYFYQLFPLLLTTPCLIRVVDFLSSLSKASSLQQCSLNLVVDDIILSYPDGDRIVDKVIGTHLLDIDVEMYNKLFWSGSLLNIEWPARKFLYEKDLANDKFVLDVEDGEAVGCPPYKPRKARIVVQVGLTVPNLPGLFKTMKPQHPTDEYCVLETGRDGDSVLVESKYCNQFLACIGTQPAQRWFVRHQPNEESCHARESETSKAQKQYENPTPGQELGGKDQCSEGTGSKEGRNDASYESCCGTCTGCSRGKEGTCSDSCEGRTEEGRTV